MEYNTHREIQESLLNRLVAILGIITIPVIFFSLIRAIDLGWKTVFYVNIAVAVFVILFSFFRNFISYNIKTLFLISVFLVLSVAGGVNTGMGGFFLPYLMVAVFIGVVFLSKSKAVLIYIGCAVIIAVIGVLNVRGIIRPAMDLNTYPTHITSWLNTIIGFLFITGLVILVIGEIGFLLSEKISKLEKLNMELSNAVSEIKTLQGILPICARCKKVRESSGYWTQVESYIQRHSDLQFSHGLCENCSHELYGNEDWFKDEREK